MGIEGIGVSEVKPLIVIARSPPQNAGDDVAISKKAMKSKQYFVYIMSNKIRTVLYVGITSNLIKRVWEHKNNVVKGFTKKYRVHDLVYYEIFDNSTNAIEREKQIKSWSRKRKDELIKTMNPKLRDLYEDLI